MHVQPSIPHFNKCSGGKIFFTEANARSICQRVQNVLLICIKTDEQQTSPYAEFKKQHTHLIGIMVKNLIKLKIVNNLIIITEMLACSPVLQGFEVNSE